jgi:hypothetical protein
LVYTDLRGVEELLELDELRAIPDAALREQVDQIGFGALLDMLADPIAEVRWGAGRILAVAGDARGVPAFCDWLQHHPRMTANADKLMAALLGRDWRDLCESGSPTSQPSPGEGGR